MGSLHNLLKGVLILLVQRRFTSPGFLFFDVIFNVVYIVERAAHTCRFLIRVGMVKAWKKVGRTNVSICFSGHTHFGGKERGTLLPVQVYHIPGMEDSHLMMPSDPNVRKSILWVLLKWF